MGKFAKKKKHHERNAIQSSGSKQLHLKTKLCKTTGFDLKSMMCMTMTPDKSAQKPKTCTSSLKELYQQLGGHLTSAESGIQTCMDIKKYLMKYIPEKLVSSVPGLLKVLPLLLPSPSKQLRCSACDVLILIFTKVGWSVVSRHCGQLVEVLCYALASPVSGVQHVALDLLKGLLLIPTPRSSGLASRLLRLYAPLLLKLCKKREAVLSALGAYNREVPKRISQLHASHEDDNMDIEVNDGDSLDRARIEALSLMVGGCDDGLVSSTAPSLLSILYPLLSKSNEHLRNVASDLLVVFVSKMEWPALCPQLPQLVQQLGYALVCPVAPAQCAALRLMSRLLAAPQPLPAHLAAHLLPFFTALLITRGLDKESSLAALTKAGAQVFPTSHSNCDESSTLPHNTFPSDESTTFPHNTFPSLVIQYFEQLNTDAEAPKTVEADGKPLTIQQLVEKQVQELQQQQNMISFIVSMCEDCLDRECDESAFALVVEPLTDERNLLCLSAVLLAEQQAMLRCCTPGKLRWGNKFRTVSHEQWWRLVRTLDVLPRLLRRCGSLTTGVKSAWLQEAARPLLQGLGDVIAASQKRPKHAKRDTAVLFALQELRLLVESLKLQYHFYDQSAEELVHYLKDLCELQTSQLTNTALGILPHLLANTVQLIVSTSGRGYAIPQVRSTFLRLTKGQRLAEPVVELFAREQQPVSIDVAQLARELGSKVLADADAHHDHLNSLADELLDSALALYREQNLPNTVKEALLEALLLIVHREDLQLLGVQGVQRWCSAVLEELCHLAPLPACVARAGLLLASRHRALLDPYHLDNLDAIIENVMNNATDLVTAEKQDILKLLLVQ